LSLSTDSNERSYAAQLPNDGTGILKNWSLKTQILALVVSAAVITLGVMIILTVNRLERHLNEELKHKALTTEALIGEHIAHDIVEGDSSQIAESMHSLKKKQDILDIKVYDLSGDLICEQCFDSVPKYNNLDRSRFNKPGIKCAENICALYRPLEIDGQKVGYLWLAVSHERSYDHVQITIFIILGSAVVILVFVFIFGVIIARKIVQPIRTFEAAVDRISLGDMLSPVDIEGLAPEFKNLGSVFNDMQASLNRTFDELDETRSHLQHLVADRTRELKKTLQTSADIVAAIPSGLAIFNFVPPGRFFMEAANPEAHNLLGKRLIDMYSREMSDIWKDKTYQALNIRLARVMQTGKSLVTEFSAPDGDTEVNFEHLRLKAFKMSDNRLGMVFEDISRERRIENDLLASEARYRTLFETATDAIFIMKGDKFIDCNGPTLKMFGCKRDEIIGQPPFRFSPPFQPDGCDSKIKAREKIKAALDGYPQTFEWRHWQLDKTEFDAEVSLNRMDIENETFLLAIVRDITQRKQAEDAIIKAEHEKEVILDSLVEHVVYQDNEMNILWANRAAADSIDLDRADIIGRKCYKLWNKSDEPCPDCPVKKAMETGEICQTERQTPDGRIWFIRGCPVRDRGGRIIGAIETTLDITAERLARRQREEMKTRLERAEKMESLGILAGGVAHDLNNMLGPLVGYADLLLMKLEEENPIRKQVERIGKSAQDAADVIQDLLTLARRGRYEMVPTDINEVIESFLDSAAFSHLKRSRPTITVDWQPDTDLPSTMGSASHLYKAVMNLVINAYDAMPNGGSVTIRTSQRHLTKLTSGYGGIVEGDYIVLEVEDSGMGIPPDELDKIFEPYYSKKKMGTSGSGLGLAVVYGIIKDHKGYYDIFSKVGRGSKFVLYLPVSTDPIIRGEEAHECYGGTETILVVDDFEDQRQIAADILSSLGYRVETAENGHEALHYLKSHRVELVILDMIMETDFDGLDTYREILKIHPEQKAIIVSGFSPTERAGRMQRMGAGAYIKKPYTLKEIAGAVRRELDRDRVVSENPAVSS